MKSQCIYLNKNGAIIKLLNFRNETVSLIQDKKFDNIPYFSSKSISTFINSLQNGNSIKNSLELIGYSRCFTPDIINQIYNKLEKKQLPSDDQLVIFLFDCLSFLAFEPEKNREEIIKKIFIIFNQNAQSNFSSYFCDIFTELTLQELNQSTNFDLDILQLIIQQIAMNSSFDSSIPFLINSIVKRCAYTKDIEMIEPVLSVIVLLFQEKRINFDSKQNSLLISMLFEFINKMNPNALIILAYSSQNYPDDEVIQDPYRTLPNLIFNSYTQYKSINFNPKEILIEQDIDDEPITKKEEMFNSPPEDLIIAKQTILDLCSRNMQTITNYLISFINLSSSECVSIFIKHLYKFRFIFYDSQYQIDLLIIILLLLETLATKSPIDNCISLFIESSLFSPKYTIFNKGGLNPILNIIRDSTFNFISKINSNLFIIFIENSINYPFLLAEYIMRLSYKYGNSFYNNSSIMFSLFCGLNNLQQEKNTKSKTSAYTIILTAVFSLLDDPDVASVCFSDGSFCPSFVNLLFQQDISEIAINAFTKSIARFQYLPEATINLLSTVFKMCAKKSSDSQFKNIANHLIKSLISAMTHSISIGKSISPIFDNTLNFLTSQNVPNNETLEMTLMICSLITQSQKSIELNSKRSNMILDILEAVEGTEPSDSTLMSLINQMNASTNITLDQMFIIQAPAVIPIILAAFSRSKRIDSIVNLFYDLASFSVRNITMCHEGDLCYILLNALKQEFEYNGRLLHFIIDENTSNDIFKLVSFITSFRSSVKINNVFVSLILPDKKTGQMNKYAEKAATSLHRVFSSLDKCEYQICSECPVFVKKDFNGTRLNNSFSFCFYATIDTNYVLQYPEGRFIFFKITDSQNHTLKVYLKNDLLYSEYEGKIAKWRVSIQSKQQTFISVFFMTDDGEENTICYYKIGKEMSEDIPFKNLQFDKDTTIEIGLTESFSIASDDISPVSFGKFALILPPYEDGMFNKLESNRFNDLYSTFQDVALFSDSLIINDKYHRIELSLPKLLPLHLNIHCFDLIFRNCENLPLLFTETALEIIFLITRCFNDRKYYPSLFLLQTGKVDKNDFPSFNFTKNFFDKRYCELRINDITYILSNFAKSKCRSNPIIFALFLKAIESSSNKSFQLEMLENFILNFFFWYSDNVQNSKKNLRHLANFLTDFSIPEESKRLFSEVLIQTHFIEGDFTKIYKLLPCNEYDIELICSIILDLNKKLSDLKENDKEQKEIENQMYKYFEILIDFWTNQKKDKIQLNVLIYFVENVSKCPSELIIKELITFINALNFQNEKLIVQLLVISALNSKFVFPSEYPNIACINAIKTGDISKLSKINKPFYNWQFWLTFAAVLLSSQILIRKLISLLQPNYSENYCIILCYFEILRSTKNFHNIQSLKDFFISTTLDSIISLDAPIVIDISLYTFYSMFHKLKINSYSKCVLNLFNEINGIDLDNSNQKEKKIFSASNVVDLDFDKMFKIFNQNNNFDSKMRFWASHSHIIDKNILLRIKKCLSLPRNNIENLPIASMINIFINSYIRYNKIMINSNTNSLFTYLDSNDNNIKINFESKLNYCWHEINDFLKNKRCMFDYLDLFEGNILIEKLRKQKINEIYDNNYNFDVKPIYRTSIDNDKILDFSYQINPARFVKFPFPERSIKIKVSTSLRNLKILGFRNSLIERPIENFCFYCHLITFICPVEATFHVLQNEFLLFYLTKRIQIKFSEIKLVSIVRQNCVEIFTEACSSYLISLSQDDFHIFTEIAHFPFTVISNKDEAKKKIVRKFTKNKMTVFNLILSLNLISGRSFNDAAFFPVFPIVADKSLDFSIVSNREYPIVVEKWFDYIYGREKKKINEMKNNEIELEDQKETTTTTNNDENERNKDESTTTTNNDNNERNKTQTTSNDDENEKNKTETTVTTNNNENETKKADTINNDENERNKDKITNNCNDDTTKTESIQDHKNENSKTDTKSEETNTKRDIESDKSNERRQLMKWNDFLQEARNTQNCFSPLFFTTYDHFIDSFSDKSSSEMQEIVYMMKKRIENSTKVLSWSKAFFNIQFENSPSNKKKQFETIKMNLAHEVICSSFFENSEDTFAVLFSNGKIELLFIHENAIKSLKKFLDSFQIKNMNIISLRNYVILYDLQKYVYYRISINNFNFIDYIAYSTCVTHITSVSDQLILVIDKHHIISFDCEKFPQYGKVLFTEKSEIEQITTSSSFDAIIFSTKDGFLKVISSKLNEHSKCLLAEININQKCQKILITKENGFIVAKTKDDIFTFSFNGRMLGDAKYNFSFIQAITAVSPQKVDFVFFIDERNQLNAFEAFLPENILTIASDLPKISSMILNRDRNILYLITYDGNILAHPVCF